MRSIKKIVILGVQASGSRLGLAPLSRLRPLLIPQLKWIGISIVLIMVARLTIATFPLFIGEIIDRLSVALAEKSSYADVFSLIIGMLAVLLTQVLLISAASIIANRVSISIITELRRTLFERMQNQGVAFYRQYSIGDLMARTGADVSFIKTFLLAVPLSFVPLFFGVFTTLSLMFWLVPQITWLLILPLSAALPMIIYDSRRLRKTSRELQESNAALTQQTQEAFSGVRTLQVMAREQSAINSFDHANHSYINAFMKQIKTIVMIAIKTSSIMLITNLILIGWGGYLVLSGAISKGTLIAFFTYLSMLIEPGRQLGKTLNIPQQAAAACERTFDILDLPNEPPNRPSGKTPAQIQGQLDLHNFSYRYPGTSRDVLQAISISVKAGQSLAIMGSIGAGKSTLLAAFPRLIETAPEQVCLDGHDVANWPLNQLRSQIALVPQNAFLFHQSFRENLSYDDPSREKISVFAAAKHTELDMLIESIPDGLDTLIGERGLTLSGGQRQRATLSRGIIREAPVLLLDDSFASVDTATEARILKCILKIRRHMTTVLVTHRVATAQHADHILILDDGKVSEYGDHATLQAAGGWYATLAGEQNQSSETTRRLKAIT